MKSIIITGDEDHDIAVQKIEPNEWQIKIYNRNDKKDAKIFVARSSAQKDLIIIALNSIV